MEVVKNEIRVESVLEGTPAEAAGLLEGDIIREVDGEDVSGMSLSEVVGLIRGEEGTTVKIGVLRPPSSDLEEFDIVRGRIEIPVIETELKEGGVGYLRLTDWTEDVDQKLSAALSDLKPVCRSEAVASRAASRQNLTARLNPPPSGPQVCPGSAEPSSTTSPP